MLSCGSRWSCSICSHENSLSSRSAMSSPCCLHLTFSLPFHNMKHHLDSTTFSKTTLYTENIFQKLHGRKATLKNPSRTSITKVAETCEQNTPSGFATKEFATKELAIKELATSSGSFSGRHLSIIRCTETVWRTRSTSSND